MQKAAVIDLLTTLRAIALATALVGLVLLLGTFVSTLLGGIMLISSFAGLAGAFGMMGLIGGLIAAAILSVARWLVARSAFHSPQRG